ncbi:MAG: hypothetical protein HRU05_04910 [Oceanospirillaceae bacterium]|nr:hypothetical protein [Oceanospirillaceae bacterium]
MLDNQESDRENTQYQETRSNCIPYQGIMEQPLVERISCLGLCVSITQEA